MSHPLLEAKDLRIAFYGVTAVDGITFQINEGEFVAIIGPNGSGKTTFLNLCSGYLKPDSGEVCLDGTSITAMAPRSIAHRGIARAFQIPQLFLDQTVLDNLLIAMAAKQGIWSWFENLGAGHRREEAMDLLALVGLQDQAGQFADALPEGKRKLLDIVLALALKPRLILLDEPTSGVSSIERFALMETLMRALRQAKVTALFVEHDMEVVQRYSDRVAVWDAGRVLVQGPPSEVFNNAEVLHKVVGV